MEPAAQLFTRIAVLSSGLCILFTGCGHESSNPKETEIDAQQKAPFQTPLPQPDLPASQVPHPEPRRLSTSEGRQVIERFLESKSPSERAKLIWKYDDPKNESLRIANENFQPFDEKFALKFQQWEKDPQYGGPYWMYTVSTNSDTVGFPLILQEDDGPKVNIEILNEFRNRHFVDFTRSDSPHFEGKFRIILEWQAEYLGADAVGIKNLNSFQMYKAAPPYGGLEFACPIFVRKRTPVAAKLDELVPEFSSPLAVIAKIKRVSLSKGKTHFVLDEIVTDGWFE